MERYYDKFKKWKALAIQNRVEPFLKAFDGSDIAALRKAASDTLYNMGSVPAFKWDGVNAFYAEAGPQGEEVFTDENVENGLGILKSAIRPTLSDVPRILKEYNSNKRENTDKMKNLFN